MAMQLFKMPEKNAISITESNAAITMESDPEYVRVTLFRYAESQVAVFMVV